MSLTQTGDGRTDVRRQTADAWRQTTDAWRQTADAGRRTMPPPVWVKLMSVLGKAHVSFGLGQVVVRSRSGRCQVGLTSDVGSAARRQTDLTPDVGSAARRQI